MGHIDYLSSDDDGGDTSTGDSSSDGGDSGNPRLPAGGEVVKFKPSQLRALAALASASSAILFIVFHPGQFIAANLNWAIRNAFSEEAEALLTEPTDFVLGVVAGSFEQILKLALGEEAGVTAFNFLSDPVGFIQEVIFQTVASFILGIATLVLDTILVIFFGSDKSIGIGLVLVDGRPVESSPGLLDIPFLISSPIANAIAGFFGSLTGQINEFFIQVGTELEPLGVAAPAVATGLWVVFAGIILWLGYIVFSALQLADVLEPFIAPFRRALDFLFR